MTSSKLDRVAAPSTVSPAGVSDRSREGTPLHVCVVEDDPLLRWSIVETLAAAGCVTTEAADGASALRALSASAQSTDVVVLDYRLRDSNDLALLAAIRQRAPRSAVLLMTAFGTPGLSDQALALGASRVIEKPFEMHDLMALVVACAMRPRVSGRDQDVH
jgi:DNA-binding NtrC family response regulator